MPLLTPDGRYVVFASSADNLVAVNGSNSLPYQLSQKLNVFLRDRANDTTTLVSVNQAGIGGDGDSVPAAVSANGRFVLFESGADDLVAGDTNGVTDVFLRDVWSHLTVLVSVSTNGGVGNGVSRGATLTPDGRWVAFTSAASNLVAGDTNGIPDVFVRDWQNGITSLASVGAQSAAADHLVGSESPELSDDGRYVAFYSVATNLVSGVTNSGEIYLRDLTAGTTVVASAGAHALLGATTVSFNHTLSTNGNFVAYEACTNPPASSAVFQGLVLRFSLATGSTDLIDTNAWAPPANLEDFHDLAMTPDGRFVAFVGNTNTGFNTAIYLWDADSGLATLVSSDGNGNVPTNTVCDWPAVDPTGQWVAFLSNAQGLVTNSLTGDFHLYRHDLQTGITALLDAETNGMGTGVEVGSPPSMSDDGTLTAFVAPDGRLVANDANHACDVFVRNINASTNELISVRALAFPTASPNGASLLAASAASSNGRWVVFASEADNIVPNDTNGFRDIFARDQWGGSNQLVSVSTNGGSSDGLSFEPTISPDGGFVVFTSAAENLVAGDTNGVADVFLRDLAAGTTTLVSANAAGTGAGNGASGSAQVSANGDYVLFQSLATNLSANRLTSASNNLFLRDVRAGITHALTTDGATAGSMTPDGQWVAFTDVAGAEAGKVYLWSSQNGAVTKTNKVTAGITSLSLSPDGNRLIFVTGSPLRVEFADLLTGSNGAVSSASYVGSSRTGLRFSANGRWATYAASPTTAITNQVYVFDFQTRSQRCVSTVWGTTNNANGYSDSPDISADGRFIAYRSAATNLVAGGTDNLVPNVYLYDAESGTTTLLSADRLDGGAPNNRSRTPVFSGDGHTLLFQSWASDLAPLDFNQNGDVFALAFLYVSLTAASPAGQGPILTWPNRPGETYSVQFTDDLTAPTWQDVSAPVTVTGNQASLTDPAPAGETRFYRVVVQ
jgi:Tol biopolymer transport system component